MSTEKPIVSVHQYYGLLALVIIVVSLYVISQLTNLPFYLVWISALSISTFVLYGLDKRDAVVYGKGAQNRTPEILLHLLAFAGGFLGGWLGMFLFWHKIKHLDFWGVLTLSTMLHVVLIMWVFELGPFNQ